MTRLGILAFALATSACSSNDAGSDPAADASTDAPTEAAAEAGSSEAGRDAESDAMSDASQELRQTKLVASFEVSREFELAVFGKNKDGSLHVEVHGGAPVMDCSVQESAAPDRTMTMGAVPTGSGTHELSAVLFDFERALTEEPVLSSESGSIEILDFADSQFLSALVEFEFPGGSIAGSLFAMHCPVLDEP